jgi:ectoine hydroxylase-related dioxygenase (phytanoyl-CoA dioxygenase family)
MEDVVAATPIIDYGLSVEELTSYRRHGYLIRREVFSGDELLRLREVVELAVSSAYEMAQGGETYHLDGKRFVDIGSMTVQFEHSTGSHTIRVIEPAHHLHPGLATLVDDPRIVQPMQSIIGCADISVWTNKLNLKRAGEGSGFGWHQDSPYWVHDSDHVDLLPNVYLAFDDANEANGCLRVIDRSHQQGCLPGTSNGSQLGGFFTEPECFNESDQVLMEAPAGSLIFFDPHTIHGSQPNHSDQPRRAIVMTYQPADFPMLKTGEVRNVSL